MKTARFLAIPAVVVLLALAAAPAAAQDTRFSFRYWPTQTFVSLAGGSFERCYDTNLLSLSVRRDFANDWGVSFNGDFGSQRNWGYTWSGATAGNLSFWNVNLHRNFGDPGKARTSIFAGWEKAGDSSTFGGVPQTHTYTGFRLGGDVNLTKGQWSFQGWGAIGLGGTGTSAQPGSTTGTGPGRYHEFGALIGYTLASGWTVEGGYRWHSFFVPEGGSFSAAEFRTTGFFLGVSMNLP